MATDIIGTEITVGDFVIWLQARKMIPLFCRAQNQLVGISPAGNVRTIHPRRDSRYVIVSRNAMERMLLRNPLPDNLYSIANRYSRSPAAREQLANARRTRANAFYRNFIGGEPGNAPMPDPEARHRQALNDALAFGRDVATPEQHPDLRELLAARMREAVRPDAPNLEPIRRPILALPRGQELIIQNPAPSHVLPSRGPRSEATLTFTNADGVQETIPIANVKAQPVVKEEKTNNRQPSVIDLDFD
jgi:hypothetical protein